MPSPVGIRHASQFVSNALTGGFLGVKPLQPTIAAYGYNNICLLQVGLFICLNHELVDGYHIGIGNLFQWLQTERCFESLLFNDTHASRVSWYAVDALWVTWAGDIDIALPDQLAVLFAGEDGTKKLLRTSVRL